jgi:hypothetical protein
MPLYLKRKRIEKNSIILFIDGAVVPIALLPKSPSKTNLITLAAG